MMASRLPRRIVCVIVRVAEDASSRRAGIPAAVRRSIGLKTHAGDRFAAVDNRLPRRPSEQLPWHDPFIAGLVQKLQSDVRRERTGFARTTSPVADLDPPCPTPDFDLDWESWEAPQRTRHENDN